MFGFVQRPGKKEIIVPLGAVLATKRPQQKKRKNEHFEKPAPVRAANVQALAGRTAPEQIKSIVGHGRRADEES
jgi:hypothetical protein